MRRILNRCGGGALLGSGGAPKLNLSADGPDSNDGDAVFGSASAPMVDPEFLQCSRQADVSAAGQTNHIDVHRLQSGNINIKYRTSFRAGPARQ
mmetsp:Transcript_65494/g.188419  ORF Transcript_65494/g.188419 Transcript_65494/m.188419 type:complete len:94 (+) Transcript_65494:55-336(+)